MVDLKWCREVANEVAQVADGTDLGEDCANAIRKLVDEVERLRTEALTVRYRTALEKIHKEEGRVCTDFALCDHRGCDSSYAAWAIAEEALNP